MQVRWDVDETAAVELKIGGFSSTELHVNGVDTPIQLSFRKKNAFAFDLSNARHAEISVTPQFGSVPVIALRVDGQLIVPTGKTVVTCAACGATVRPNDRFCGGCGQAMPPAENYQHQQRLKEASGTIWMLAGLFVLSGVVLFFLAQSQAADALAKLSGMDPDATLPNPINGVTYTVAGLRDQINWETWSVLAVNLGLAAIMAGLAFWARWAPLAAILVAAAVYAVVVVTNAIIDPATLAQGIYIKLIVVFFLYRGIRGALALRSANA